VQCQELAQKMGAATKKEIKRNYSYKLKP